MEASQFNMKKTSTELNAHLERNSFIEEVLHHELGFSGVFGNHSINYLSR